MVTGCRRRSTGAEPVVVVTRGVGRPAAAGGGGGRSRVEVSSTSRVGNGRGNDTRCVIAAVGETDTALLPPGKERLEKYFNKTVRISVRVGLRVWKQLFHARQNF